MKVKFTSDKGYIPADSVSQIVVSGHTAFLSGQISYDVASKEYIHDSMRNQTQRVLRNIRGMLQDLGLTMDDIAYCNISISHMELFSEMDAAYQQFFGSSCPPARKTVEAKIWGDLDIEISAVVLADHEIEVPVR